MINTANIKDDLEFVSKDNTNQLIKLNLLLMF